MKRISLLFLLFVVTLAYSGHAPVDLGPASSKDKVKFAVCADWPCPAAALRVVEVRRNLQHPDSQRMIRAGKLHSAAVLDAMGASRPTKEKPKVKPLPGECTLGGKCGECGTLYQVTPTLYACDVQVCVSCS